MATLNINGRECSFNFGFGFIREVNKVRKGDNGEFVGLQYRIGQMHDGDPEALCDVLIKARENTQEPTAKELEEWLENPATDIDRVYEDVMGFLLSSNCTKKIARKMIDAIEQEETRQAEKAKKNG